MGIRNFLVDSTGWLFHSLFAGRIGIWKCWFLWKHYVRCYSITVLAHSYTSLFKVYPSYRACVPSWPPCQTARQCIPMTIIWTAILLMWMIFEETNIEKSCFKPQKFRSKIHWVLKRFIMMFYSVTFILSLGIRTGHVFSAALAGRKALS